MKPAHEAVQRPRDARLLAVDRHGSLRTMPRAAFIELVRRGDLLVANDAATLPASLQGVHAPTGAPIEIRLAGRPGLQPDAEADFVAVAFGAGDHRTPTEARPLPPPLRPGDRLVLGPLCASVLHTLAHPRLVALRLDGTPGEIWSGLARHGRPVQYAHLAHPLDLWDVWTRVAARPVAFEPPSAGFVLDWALLGALKQRGIGFATLTHAAGLSSTGDAALDARLPLPEPYTIPRSTADAIGATRARGGRVIAIGTTVTRALEHAASAELPLRAGAGLATQRIGAATRLRIVDVIVSGTHEPGTSHHDLLRAFIDDARLACVDRALEEGGWRTHEFGDSVWIERRADCSASIAPDWAGRTIVAAEP